MSMTHRNHTTVHSSAFILSLFLAVAACAPSQKYVTLSDGTKAPAAPTYLSARDMGAKGKNSFGVPEANFAFYPEKYEAGKKDVVGRDMAEAKEYFDAMKNLGRVSGEFQFMPSSAPAWDHSYVDPPSIRHDCFSVERLFVVPWGGEEAAAIVAGGRPKVKMYVNPAGQWLLWSGESKIATLYDMSGRVLRVSRSEGSFEELMAFAGLDSGGRDIQTEFRRGDLTTKLESRGWNGWAAPPFMSLVQKRNDQTICKIYLPPQVPSGWSCSEEEYPCWAGGVIDGTGALLWTLFTAAGIEAYRYQTK
jgi:hypothetical protein